MATRTLARTQGWGVFAGVVFVVVGIFNFIDGIVAILHSNYFVNDLVFGNLRAWGWTILILGIIVFLLGLAILAGQAWAAFTGIFFAILDMIGQLLWLRTYPIWSITIIALNVFVIYALAVYGMARADADL